MSSHIQGSCVWCLDPAQRLIKPNPGKMSLWVLVPATTFLSAVIYGTQGHRVSLKEMAGSHWAGLKGL